MTLDRLRPVIAGALDPSVTVAKRAGLTPNAISLLAMACAGTAAVLFYVAPGAGPRELYVGGGVLVALNGWLDLVDGELARDLDIGGPAGDLIDHVLDRYADLALIAGLAGGLDRYALGFAAVTGVLMTSYLGTQAQAVGLDRVYGGLVGRADRLALIAAVGVVAGFVSVSWSGLSLVAWLLVFFAVVGHVTTLQRFYHALEAL